MRKFIFALLFLVHTLQTCVPAYGSTETKIGGTYAPGIRVVKNLVLNPDCEANTLNITSSAGTFTRSTSTPLVTGAGAQCSWAPGAGSATLKFNIATLPTNLTGGQCEASFYTKANTTGHYAAYLEYDSVQVTSNLALDTAINGQKFSIFYPCGSATTRKLVITSLTTPSTLLIGGVSFGESLNVGFVNGPVAETQLNDQAGNGSTATKIPYYTNTTTNNTMGLYTFAMDSTNGTSFTFLQPALVTAFISFYNASVGEQLGFSKNGTVTTNIYSNSDTIRQCMTQNIVVSATGYASGATCSFTVAAGDVIRPHTAGGTCGDTNSCMMHLTAQSLNSIRAVNLSQSPAYWSGYHDTTCSWSRTNTALGAFTDDASCALTQGSNNIGVSCASTGSVSPAILCTFPKAGKFEVCASFGSFTGTSDATATLSLTDGTTPLDQAVYQNATGWTPIKLCGQIYASTTTSTFTVQGATGSGSLTVTGASPKRSSIEWTVKDITLTGSNPLLIQGVAARDNTNGVTTLNTVVSKSANYTATDQDETIIFTADATLSLPAAASYKGKKYHVQASGATTEVTIDPNSTETVCGQTTVRLEGTEAGTIQSDGSNWIGLDDFCYKKMTAYFTNGGSCAVSTQRGTWVTSVTDPGTGQCGIVWNSATWSTGPWCTTTANANGAPYCPLLGVPTTTGVTTLCQTAAGGGTSTDSPFWITCVGPR